MSRSPIRMLALAAATALVLTACGSDEADPGTTDPTAAETMTEPTEPTEPTETQPATTEPTEDSPEEPDGSAADDEAGAGEVDGVPVYYLIESPDGPRLVREFRTVPDEGDLVTSAVMAMMSLEPRDPDYSSLWSAPGSVSVTRDGDTITVDVPSSVFSGGAGAAYEATSYQQLVHTVTAAAAVDGEPASTVVLLQDGAPGDGWGHIGVGEPWTRAPQTDVFNWTWVTAPAEGETVPEGEVTIHGYGASFEGNFVITVSGTAADGNPVEVIEPTTSTNGMGFGTWEFTLELAPGEYTVTAENTSGKDDFTPDTDDKAFTVAPAN